MNFPTPRALMEKGSGARPPGTTDRFGTASSPLRFLGLAVGEHRGGDAPHGRAAAGGEQLVGGRGRPSHWCAPPSYGSRGGVRLSDSAAPGDAADVGVLAGLEQAGRDVVDVLVGVALWGRPLPDLLMITSYVCSIIPRAGKDGLKRRPASQ